MPKLQNSRGAAEIFLLILVVIFAMVLSGLFNHDQKENTGGGQIVASSSGEIRGACCDLGDGAACKPYTDDDKTFTYKGVKYGLLKSGVKFAEAVAHLADSGEKAFGKDPIILNTSDSYLIPNHSCATNGQDMIWGPNGSCNAIPNDQLIYVCKENCHPYDPSKPIEYSGKLLNPFCDRHDITCYGDKETVYDAYFDTAHKDEVPPVIKQCQQSNNGAVQTSKTALIVLPTPAADVNLQLKTLKVIEITASQGSAPWVSPWCKPAIYLYPPTKMNVNVKIAPQGNLTLTIPKYPIFGWDVLANPGGQLSYNKQLYPYLYYEAQIPDNLINQPKEGFVVEYANLEAKLDEVLIKLGLNASERKDFIAYWIKALPKSNYYFFGVVPQSNLDQMTPLIVTPKPNQTIRVTLSFQALDQPISVEEPKLVTPIRTGFTVVEWGGLFKKDQKHNFTCLM